MIDSSGIRARPGLLLASTLARSAILVRLLGATLFQGVETGGKHIQVIEQGLRKGYGVFSVLFAYELPSEMRGRISYRPGMSTRTQATASYKCPQGTAARIRFSPRAASREGGDL